jgi:hypothetical protein
MVHNLATMVKNRGIIWNYYSEISIGNYKGDVCKFCRAKQFVTNAAKMARHIMRYPIAPCQETFSKRKK